MTITTKIGDSGETRLYSGQTVNKVSRRIAAIGDIDELVCMLGLTYDTVCRMIFTDNKHGEFFKQEITYLQKKLFIVGSEIATLEPELSNLEERICEEEVRLLDNSRMALEQKIQLPKGFILPGHRKSISAYLDMARAISRRCERSIVGIYNEGFISNKNLLVWMNRLSDYLYLLARYSENNNYTLVKEN